MKRHRHRNRHTGLDEWLPVLFHEFTQTWVFTPEGECLGMFYGQGRVWHVHGFRADGSLVKVATADGKRTATRILMEKGWENGWETGTVKPSPRTIFEQVEL